MISPNRFNSQKNLVKKDKIGGSLKPKVSKPFFLHRPTVSLLNSMCFLVFKNYKSVSIQLYIVIITPISVDPNPLPREDVVRFFAAYAALHASQLSSLCI